MTIQNSTQGLNFADDAGGGSLNQLSNAQTIATGTHSWVLEVDAAGNWSYSIDGATATTGASTFNVARDFQFVAYMQDNHTDFIRAEEITTSISALQEEFLTWEFGLFIHFNMATFNERQWATGTEDPASFTPTALDCNQWIDAAVDAGMKYAVLTVKHTGGWCLWDSGHTESHDITAFTNYENGQGDIVRDFVNACRERDVKVGFYYCLPGDFARRNLPPGEEDLLHGLPPEAAGQYTEFIKKQLTELLTDYGPIDLMWFDQYENKYTGGDWRDIKDHVKSLQPRCLVIANNSENYGDTDLHSYEYGWRLANGLPALPAEGNVDPSEVADNIGNGWFWTSAARAENMDSAEAVVDLLEVCNSRRANYLLNVAPDNTGLIPDWGVARLQEIGQLRGAAN